MMNTSVSHRAIGALSPPAVLFVLFLCGFNPVAHGSSSAAPPAVQPLRRPLHFENTHSQHGQAESFLARGYRYAILLQPNTLQLRLSHSPASNLPVPGSDPAADSSPILPQSPGLVRITLEGSVR